METLEDSDSSRIGQQDTIEIGPCQSTLHPPGQVVYQEVPSFADWEPGFVRKRQADVRVW